MDFHMQIFKGSDPWKMIKWCHVPIRKLETQVQPVERRTFSTIKESLELGIFFSTSWLPLFPLLKIWMLQSWQAYYCILSLQNFWCIFLFLYLQFHVENFFGTDVVILFCRFIHQRTKWHVHQITFLFTFSRSSRPILILDTMPWKILQFALSEKCAFSAYSQANIDTKPAKQIGPGKDWPPFRQKWSSIPSVVQPQFVPLRRTIWIIDALVAKLFFSCLPKTFQVFWASFFLVPRKVG